MTVSIGTLLASTLATGAQNQNQLTLNAINNTMTTRLNNQIAQIQSQASDTTTVDLLQNQLSAAQSQNTAYSQAASQSLTNEGFLDDINTQLVTMNTAATNGDSSTFDNALALAQSDINDLTVVNYVAGTQPDGVANLKYNGLGIQSSASYDLSTPAGQTQAESDIANAKTAISQILTTTTQNQEIATSQSDAYTDDINNLTLQLSQISNNQNTTVQTEISNLKQKEQDQYHVLELTLANSNNASSVLTTAASDLATVLASQPGSRTASTTNAFFTALSSSATDANEMNATALGDAKTQPSSSTSQDNTIAQGASGALLDIFG